MARTMAAFAASIPEPPEAATTQSGFDARIASFIMRTSSIGEFGLADKVCPIILMPDFVKEWIIFL